MHSLEKIVDGVTGLGRKPEFPYVVGEKLGYWLVDVPGLNLTGGFMVGCVLVLQNM